MSSLRTGGSYVCEKPGGKPKLQHRTLSRQEAAKSRPPSEAPTEADTSASGKQKGK